MDDEKDFRIFGELDLTKSCIGLESDDEHWFLQGMILTDDKDVQGETPLLKSMDWKYFDEHGMVKYEHDPDGRACPMNVIGVPHIRKSIEHGEWLRTRLLPRDEKDLKKGLTKDYARETASLIKALSEHNAKYPEKQRTMGFSVEGDYLGKSKNGKYWGKVVNVVVSPNPIGTTTYAEMAKSHNNQLIKSLQTGSSFTPETQTGGAALRKESLDKDIKSQTFDNKGASKMKDKFKNVDEAKDYFMGEDGMDEEAAMKKAKELFPDKEKKEIENKFEDIEKSLANNNSLLTRVAEKLGLVKSHKEEKTEEVPPAEEATDITPYFTELVTLVKSMGDKIDVLAEGSKETVGSTAEGFKNVGEMIKSIKTENEELKKANEEVQKMLKAIGMKSQDISFLDPNDNVSTVEGEEGKKLNKSVVGELLFKAQQEGRLSPVEITKFEMSNGQLTPAIKALPEVAEMLK